MNSQAQESWHRVFDGIYTVDPVTGCFLRRRLGEDGIVAGYSYIVFGRGARFRAHRLSYELWNGKKLRRLHACHTCDNSSCVNPDHVFPGTRSDNMCDMVEKGRHWTNQRPWKRVQGEKHPLAKLSLEDAVQIRKSPESQPALAKQYGVAKSLIYRIKAGKSWPQAAALS